MDIGEEMAVGLITGFLFSSGHAAVNTNQRDGMRATSDDGAGEFIMLFGRLDSGIACKLRPYLTTTDQIAARPSSEDLQVQKRALALIAKAIANIDWESTFIETATEYREG